LPAITRGEEHGSGAASSRIERKKEPIRFRYFSFMPPLGSVQSL
jgi:hypothetical protein